MKNEINLTTHIFGSDGKKSTHTNICVVNHNGIVSFDPKGQVVTDYSEPNSLGADYERALSETSAKQYETSSTSLLAPYVNACTVVIIKNRTTGTVFLCHHNPGDLKESDIYDSFFSSAKSGDQIDVLVCAGDMKENLFSEKCVERGIFIETSRSLNSKNILGTDKPTFGGEKKGVRDLNISYNPADDTLVIFGDKKYAENVRTCCFVAEGVFANPKKPIKMGRLYGIAGKAIAEMFDNSFVSFLPLFSGLVPKNAKGFSFVSDEIDPNFSPDKRPIESRNLAIKGRTKSLADKYPRLASATFGLLGKPKINRLVDVKTTKNKESGHVH